MGENVYPVQNNYRKKQSGVPRNERGCMPPRIDNGHRSNDKGGLSILHEGRKTRRGGTEGGRGLSCAQWDRENSPSSTCRQSCLSACLPRSLVRPSININKSLTYSPSLPLDSLVRASGSQHNGLFPFLFFLPFPSLPFPFYSSPRSLGHNLAAAAIAFHLLPHISSLSRRRSNSRLGAVGHFSK